MPPKAEKKITYVVETFAESAGGVTAWVKPITEGRRRSEVYWAGIEIGSMDDDGSTDHAWNGAARDRVYVLEELVIRLHEQLARSRDDVQTLIKARDRATAERHRREALEARTPEEKAQAKDQAAAKVLENLRNSNTMLRKQNVEMRAEMGRVREAVRAEKQVMERERREMLALPRNAKYALETLQRILAGVPDAVAAVRPQEGRTWELASGLGEALAGGSSPAAPKATPSGEPRYDGLEID